MTESELLQKINYHTKRLGIISMLAFKKDSLEEILEELERLDQLCIKEHERVSK